jgi:hypothetical protein
MSRGTTPTPAARRGRPAGRPDPGRAPAASRAHRPSPARRPRLLAALGLGLWAVSAGPSVSDTRDPAALCDAAAAEASRASGVPLRVMQAITRAETGRTLRGVLSPWPWTVNHAGDGHWFAHRSDALDYVVRARTEGAGNLDIGCFQINLHWHGHAFERLEHMLDPALNARYAADFLTELHREFGHWEAAVGAFHSRTPRHAQRYLARYRRIHAALAAPGAGDASRRDPAEHRPASRPVPRALDVSRRPALLAGRSDSGLGGLARPLLRSGGARPLWEAAR